MIKIQLFNFPPPIG